MHLASPDPHLSRRLALLVLATIAFLAFLALAQERTEARAQEPAPPGFDHSHSAWTAVLKEHVKGDRFDYQALVEGRGELDRYLLQLGAVAPEELQAWTREQQLAFWINAYHAHVVHLVAKNYPLESIRDLGTVLTSVWKKDFIRLRGLHPDGGDGPLSLDDVEHGILRPKFKDARVHAAINRASIGCPRARAEAFVAERLEAQLDEQARAWLADPARNRFDREHGSAQVSEIFRRFEEDFERDAGSVRKWLARYAPAAEAEWLASAGEKLKLAYLDYDWKLNDLERPQK